MLRWEISPDFKTRRAGDYSRPLRSAPVRVAPAADGRRRATALFSLPVVACAILLFSMGGARGPQIITAMKNRAYQTAAQLRTHDPFLRRPGIDYTPTGSAQRRNGGAEAPPPSRTAPLRGYSR